MTVRLGRVLTLLLTTAALAVGALAVPVLPGGPARASAEVNGKDYDAGYIVSDANFYDGSALSAEQVQDFLADKGRSCAAGEQPCIKDYRAATIDKPKDEFCNGYSAGTQSAAEIIAGVGESCGISQKALIVLLQKEQSLINRTKPTSRAYQIATGYGCPDGAPCDTEYYGFFNQLYRAAWQYRVYKSKPTSYGFQVGANTIPYNFNASCGSGPVQIKNEATRALYIYTPFQANEALLKDVYGQGDSCSSFAQVHTWVFWSDWFGSPTGGPAQHEFAVAGDIKVAWEKAGGFEGPGRATGPETWSSANGGGWYQSFQNGTVTHTSAGGGYVRRGTGIAVPWQSAGAQEGSWGWPRGQEACVRGICQVRFSKVTATWTSASGTFTTPR